MHKVLVGLLALLVACPARAEEGAAPDITGLWIVSIPQHACLDGALPVAAQRFVSRITRAGDHYRLRAKWSYEDARLGRRRITASEHPEFSVDDPKWGGPKRRTVAVVQQLNRLRPSISFEGLLSEDGATIVGTDQGFCFRADDFTITAGPDFYPVKVTMTRAEPSRYRCV